VTAYKARIDHIMCEALKMSEFAKEVILGRNLSLVCRTCLKKEGVISIFSDKVSETGYTLQERIMAFAYVEVRILICYIVLVIFTHEY